MAKKRGWWQQQQQQHKKKPKGLKHTKKQTKLKKKQRARGARHTKNKKKKRKKWNPKWKRTEYTSTRNTRDAAQWGKSQCEHEPRSTLNRRANKKRKQKEKEKRTRVIKIKGQAKAANWMSLRKNRKFLNLKKKTTKKNEKRKIKNVCAL